MFKIYEFRKAHEMYQSEFAEIVGLTQSAISRIEKDGLDLSKSQMEKLYERFGKEDVDAFCTDDRNISGNVISGNGNQNNSMEVKSDKELIEIIRKQNETICRQFEVQNEMNNRLASQNDKLISLLEKLSLE